LSSRRFIATLALIATLLTTAHAAKVVKPQSAEGHSLEAQALIDSIRHMRHNDPDWIATCDALYAQAVADEDQYGKVIARYDAFVFYRNKRDVAYIDSVVKYAKLTMSECLMPDNEPLFYQTWSGMISSLSSNKMFVRSENEAKELMQYAKDADSKIGLFYSYTSMANINRDRDFITQYVDYMKQALDVVDKFDLEVQGVHILHGQLALSLRNAKKRDEAYTYIKKEYARAAADTLPTHRSYPALCMAVDVVLMATSDSVAYYVPRIEETIKEIEQREFTKGGYSAFAKAYYYMALGDYDKSLEEVERCHEKGIVEDQGFYDLCKTIYSKKKDYKTALMYSDSLFAITDSIRQATNNAAVTDMLNSLEEDKLSIENKDLQMHIQKQKTMMLAIAMVSLAIIALTLCVFIIRLRATNKKLAAANAVKDDFIRSMSHEFRTPLNIINGFADILAEKTAGEPELLSYSNTIQTNTMMLAKMVEDIIKLSSYDAASQDIVPHEVIPVTEFLATRIAFLRPKVGADVDVAIKSADNGITARVGTKALCDIFDNVLLNAINFTTAGLILVSVERADGMVSVEVSDTGPGIPEDKWEWIFGRFNKLDAFRRGAGLGLSIARAAATSVGATIRVKSSSTTQPTGTTVEILLPPPEGTSKLIG